jgi:hypothetical protein
MALNRKDLLLEEKDKKVLANKDKVEKDINQGGALQNMMDTFGWKILYEGFIKPNIAEDKFLSASRENLADVRAEMRILKELMKFIETRVNSANELAKKLNK